MHVSTRRGALGALVLLATAAAASAAVPSTVAFQGYLTDPLGAPVNGTVSLVLSIYDVPAGGTSRWTETQPAVAVADGVFAVALGSVTPFPSALFLEEPRFLGIRVNGEGEMPRTELRSTPFALNARTLSDNINVTTESAGLVLWTYEHGHGMHLYFSDEGATRAIVGTNTLNGGGFLNLIYDEPGQDQRSMELNPFYEGDESALLLQDAVSSLELGDEPGLASSRNSNFVALTSTSPQSVIFRTITPPGDGYILSLGQTVARITHVTGTGTSGAVGLSEDGLGFGTAQDLNVMIASGAASGSYAIPAHVNAVFPAEEGVAKTIHIMASETSGDIELEDISLTLLFVPTAYGIVGLSFTDPAPGEGESSVTAQGTQTPGEIEAERAESQRSNTERIERELAEIRAQMEARLEALELRLDPSEDR